MTPAAPPAADSAAAPARWRVGLACAGLGCAGLACAEPASPPPGGWDAWPVMGTQITGRAVLTGTNADSAGRRLVRLFAASAGPDTVRLDYGSCSFGLRLYRDSTFVAPPVWDSRPAPNTMCTLIAYVTVLPPAARGLLNSEQLPVDSLRRAVPAGRYFLAITWRADRRAPVQRVPAGALDLRR